MLLCEKAVKEFLLETGQDKLRKREGCDARRREPRDTTLKRDLKRAGKYLIVG